MFLKLTTQNREGQIEPRIVAVADISVVKPVAHGAAPAKTCISLISQPDFPVWAIEDINEIERGLAHLQVGMAGRIRR